MDKLNFEVPEGFKSTFKEGGVAWMKDLVKFYQKSARETTLTLGKATKDMLDAVAPKKTGTSKRAQTKQKKILRNNKIKSEPIKIHESEESFESRVKTEVKKQTHTIRNIIDQVVEENQKLKDNFDWSYKKNIEFTLGVINAHFKARKGFKWNGHSTTYNFTSFEHWVAYRKHVDKKIRAYINGYLDGKDRESLTFQEQVLLVLCDPLYLYNIQKTSRHPLVDCIALACNGNVLVRHPKFNAKKQKVNGSSIEQIFAFMDSPKNVNLFERVDIPAHFLKDYGLTQNPNSWDHFSPLHYLK